MLFRGLTGAGGLTMLPATLKRTKTRSRPGEGVAVAGAKSPAKPEKPDPETAVGGILPIDDLESRRQRLEASLAAQGRSDGGGGTTARSTGATGYGQALRLSSEFIAGVAVGAGLGWIIDRLAGTSPLGLIVFLLLGFRCRRIECYAVGREDRRCWREGTERYTGRPQGLKLIGAARQQPRGAEWPTIRSTSSRSRS